METEELCEILESLKISENEVVQGKLGESYYVDGKTGEKFILPTKRPDGTLRKKIKVRPGYTPLEEQERYVPKHKRDNEPTKLTTGVSTSQNKANPNGFRKPTIEPKPVKAKSKSPESKHYPKKDKLEVKRKSGTKTKEGVTSDKLVHQVACDVENADKKSESSTAAKSQLVEQNSNVEVDSKDESEVQNPKKSHEKERPVLGSEEKKIFNAVNNTKRRIREVKSLHKRKENGGCLNRAQITKLDRLKELEEKLKMLESIRNKLLKAN